MSAVAQRKSKKGKRSRGKTGRRRSYVALVLALVAILATLSWLLLRLEKKGEEQVAPTEEVEPGTFPATRTAVLFFGSEDAEDLEQEMREIKSAATLEERARVLVEELIRGSVGSGLPVIPEGTVLREVFLKEDTGTIYLDFSRELKTHHWGGSAGELLTIRALLATLNTNLSEVKQVQLLIEGREVESLAGHIGIRRPFEVASWREMGGGY